MQLQRLGVELFVDQMEFPDMGAKTLPQSALASGAVFQPPLRQNASGFPLQAPRKMKLLFWTTKFQLPLFQQHRWNLLRL